MQDPPHPLLQLPPCVIWVQSQAMVGAAVVGFPVGAGVGTLVGKGVVGGLVGMAVVGLLVGGGDGDLVGKPVVGTFVGAGDGGRQVD